MKPTSAEIAEAFAAEERRIGEAIVDSCRRLCDHFGWELRLAPYKSDRAEIEIPGIADRALYEHWDEPFVNYNEELRGLYLWGFTVESSKEPEVLTLRLRSVPSSDSASD